MFFRKFKIGDYAHGIDEKYSTKYQTFIVIVTDIIDRKTMKVRLVNGKKEYTVPQKDFEKIYEHAIIK